MKTKKDIENDYIDELVSITKTELADRIASDLMYRSFIMREDYKKVFSTILHLLPTKIYVMKARQHKDKLNETVQ